MQQLFSTAISIYSAAGSAAAKIKRLSKGGLDQYNSLGEYRGPHTAPLCFLFLLPNYTNILGQNEGCSKYI